MPTLIYGLCALTSTVCLFLLARAYLANRSKLLFWSAGYFFLITINNILLVLDKVVWPVEVDLTFWRLGFAFASAALLLYGLVWEED